MTDLKWWKEARDICWSIYAFIFPSLFHENVFIDNSWISKWNFHSLLFSPVLLLLFYFFYLIIFIIIIIIINIFNFAFSILCSLCSNSNCDFFQNFYLFLFKFFFFFCWGRNCCKKSHRTSNNVQYLIDCHSFFLHC